MDQFASMRLSDYEKNSSPSDLPKPLTCNVLQGRYPTPVSNLPQQFELVLQLIPAISLIPEKLDLNLALVLDKSGSMDGDGKIEKLREGAKLILKMLSPNDHLTIIAFDGSFEIILSNQKIANINIKNINRKLDELRANGGTNAGPAIQKAIDEILKIKNPNSINRIILLTDGDDNSDCDCLAAAGMCGEKEIPITALGLGSDWNEKLLAKMAKISGGQVDWIDDPKKIARFFQGQVTQMQNIIITDCQFNFKAILDTKIDNVWRLKPAIEKLAGQINGREHRYNLGSIEKDGQLIYLKGTIPAKPQGDYRMFWGNLEFYISGTPHLVPLAIFFKYAYVEPITNPQVADIAGLVNMLDLYEKSLEYSTSNDSNKKALATQMLIEAAEYGTRLLATGKLPDSAKDIVKGIKEEVASLVESGSFSEHGTKKMFQTRNLGSLSNF